MAIAALLAAAWLLTWCFAAAAQDGASGNLQNRPDTTYERFLQLAEAGDPEARHLLGYMHFYGEGVKIDYDKAHEWFHLAAEEGDPKSMRNLGLFHAHAISRIPAKFYEPREANLWFSLAAVGSDNPAVSAAASAGYGRFLATDDSDLFASLSRQELGKTVYTARCAGCHGFDGHSAYYHAPSFAYGESLNKSDAILVTNFSRALNPWPHPVENIPRQGLYAALAYVRKNLAGKPTQTSTSPETELSASLLASAPTPESAPKQNHARLRRGEEVYTRFCGGCHGFNGISAYVNSPSFALGERLHKSDEELIQSVKNGRGEMPGWEDLLKPAEIRALVDFLRTLQQSYQEGIGISLRQRPGNFYRFTPKSLLDSERQDHQPVLD